jgi:hypothetical protein
VEKEASITPIKDVDMTLIETLDSMNGLRATSDYTVILLRSFPERVSSVDIQFSKRALQQE